jgi:hypothetical protein
MARIDDNADVAEEFKPELATPAVPDVATALPFQYEPPLVLHHYIIWTDTAGRFHQT